MATDNQTLSVFGQMQQRFSDATAEIGGQQEWPSEGVHEAFLTGLHVTTGEFRQSDGQMTPSGIVTFEYQLMEDPDHEENMSWRGASFNLPADINAVTLENSRKRAEIEMNRLKGFLKVITGEEPVDIQAALQKVEAMISAEDSQVCVAVRIQHRKGKNDVIYRTDFIKEVLTA